MTVKANLRMYRQSDPDDKWVKTAGGILISTNAPTGGSGGDLGSGGDGAPIWNPDGMMMAHGADDVDFLNDKPDFTSNWVTATGGTAGGIFNLTVDLRSGVGWQRGQNLAGWSSKLIAIPPTGDFRFVVRSAARAGTTNFHLSGLCLMATNANTNQGLRFMHGYHGTRTIVLGREDGGGDLHRVNEYEGAAHWITMMMTRLSGTWNFLWSGDGSEWTAATLNHTPYFTPAFMGICYYSNGNTWASNAFRFARIQTDGGNIIAQGTQGGGGETLGVAPTYRGSVSGNGGGTSFTLALPVGTLEGDTAFVFASGGNPILHPTPGFSAIRIEHAFAGLAGGVFRKILDAADIAAGLITINTAAGFYTVATLVVYAGEAIPHYIDTEHHPDTYVGLMQNKNWVMSTDLTTSDEVLIVQTTRANTAMTSTLGTLLQNNQGTCSMSVYRYPVAADGAVVGSVNMPAAGYEYYFWRLAVRDIASAGASAGGGSGGGGSSSPVPVENDGVLVVADPLALNFSDKFFVNDASGVALIDIIPGGSGSPDQIGFSMDGSGLEIVAGNSDVIRVAADCEIIDSELVADVVGDVIVEVWRATYAAYPTFTKISASAPMTLTGQQKNQSPVTGWTTTLALGDYIQFRVTGTPVDITRLSGALILSRA